VFRRGVAFDPKSDTIVRVQARTLRSRLAAYYDTEGRDDPVRVSVPKGSYVPVFELAAADERMAAASAPPARAARTSASALWAAGIGLSVIGVFWMLSTRSARTERQGCSSFAILPFHEESPSDKRFIAAALEQDLLRRLSEIPGIGLVSFESAARHQAAGGAQADLGADCVVKGKVSRLDSQLRVHLALADGATGRSFWERSYQRPVSQLAELETELARAVAGQATSAHDGIGALRTPAPIDSEAALLYLEAGHEFNRGDGDGYRRSIELYNRSIQRQPDYAAAHAGLALAWLKYAQNMFAPPNEAMPKAKAAAERALRLEPELADAHAVLGAVHLFYDWQPTAAYTELRRALTGAPSLALANEMQAVFQLMTGRFDEASASIRRARERDPLSVSLMIMSQFISLASRRYTEATQFGLKAVSREPNVGLLRALVGMNLLYSGRETEGLEQLKAGLRIDPDPAIALLSAAGFARVGDTGQARRLLAEAKVQARRRYVCAYEVASVHAVLGEADEAFRWFDKAIIDRCDCMVWLNLEPWLDRIRTDPRFEQLIRRVAFK
jgi:TolB-like protein/Tfp pilus assembly protein PilF